MVTIAAVARELGLNQASVSRLCNDKSLPSWDTVHRLRERFNWSADDQLDAMVFGEYSESFRAVTGIGSK